MVSRYDKLMARIAAGECILIDGATGTEAERRGIPKLEHAWNGGGALSHPDIIRQIHADYLAAGAELVISNSFATHFHALRDSGEAADFEAYNRRAVELAVEARDGAGRSDALVGAGISYWSWTDNIPPATDLHDAAARQADIMARAGADVIMLEMMVDIPNMSVMLKAVVNAGLPVWVGITCGRRDDGGIDLRDGDSLDAALDILNVSDIDLVNIMHTRVEFVDDAIDAVRARWRGPVGVYAHSSNEVDGKWVFDDVISPAGYRDLAAGWKARGAALVGGCCGITTAHIAEMKQSLFSDPVFGPCFRAPDAWRPQ